MDIQRWLDETVLPEQPPSPVHRPTTIPTLPLKGPELAPPGKPRTKPIASDSSLLDAPPQPTKAASISPPDGLGDAAGESRCRDASSPSSGSGNSVSSHPYARRPRRKTRLERYQPASKHVEGRGSHARRHRNHESSKTKRRHKRNRADKAGNDMVQGFHAKNVPKERLTLKPQGKLGLFSKGRASSPVKGRGLPDLVFSEMKFLQNQKDQVEPESRTAPRTKRRKRDQAHAKEEAISAYFTSVRPALTEKDVNTQAKAASQGLQDTDRRRKEQSSAVDNAIPTVEPADQTPFLGFGNRGPRHETGSYISWSESIRASSPVATPPRIASTVTNGQPNWIQDGHARVNFNVSYLPPASPSVLRHTSKDSSEQFQVSSLVRANHRASPSYSSPQHSSSPPRSDLVDRGADDRVFDRAASPFASPPFWTQRAGLQPNPNRPFASPPADLWKDNPLFGNAGESLLRADSRHSLEPETQHGVDPGTLSTLGRMLECCEAALHDQHQVSAASTTTAVVAPSQNMVQDEVTNEIASHSTAEKIPTVRFSGVDKVYHAHVPSHNGINIHERQGYQETANQQWMMDADFLLHEESAYMRDYSEDERDYDTCDIGGQSEAEPGGLEFDQLSEINLSGRSGLERHQTALSLSSRDVVKPQFWRPHKLY